MVAGRLFARSPRQWGCARSEGLNTINPLICADGDTTSVQSVLSVVSRLLNELNPDATMDCSETLGMAFIVDTCQAALMHMNRGVRHE